MKSDEIFVYTIGIFWGSAKVLSSETGKKSCKMSTCLSQIFINDKIFVEIRWSRSKLGLFSSFFNSVDQINKDKRIDNPTQYQEHRVCGKCNMGRIRWRTKFMRVQIQVAAVRCKRLIGFIWVDPLTKEVASSLLSPTRSWVNINEMKLWIGFLFVFRVNLPFYCVHIYFEIHVLGIVPFCWGINGKLSSLNV